MVTRTPLTPPPSPSAAGDEATFVADLRRLKAWSGLSYRQLERRASVAGEVLPASTTASMLGRDRLPREELLATFLHACGLDADAASPWLTARADIVNPPQTAPRRRWRAVVAAAVAAFAVGVSITAVLDTTVDREVVVLAP